MLWRIGAPTGHSADLVDTYKQPNLLGDVTWTVGAEGQRWPMFHPSEADPLGGRDAPSSPLSPSPAA